MKEDWEKQKFEDCFKLKSGDGLTSKMMGNGGKYPVFGGNGIAGLHTNYNLSGSNVIIGRVGALCGNVRHISSKIWLTDNAFKISDFRFDFDHTFLTYLLNFKNLREFARQSAQPVISNSSLKDLVLEFPKSIEEQKKIAAILDEAFTAIATAKANAEQNLKNARELFESYKSEVFDNNGLGYEEIALIGVCDKITQGPNPKYDKNESAFFRVLKTKNLYDKQIFYDEADKVSESVFNTCLSSELKNGDVLLAIVGQGSINKCNVFENKTAFRFIYTRALGLIRTNRLKLNPYYLNSFLQSKKGKSLIDSGIGGTSGQQVVTTTYIKKLKIPLPTLNEQSSIVQKIDTVSKEIVKLEEIYKQKIKMLEELKITVLRKAFNGELNTN
jgi:type I restriction enzyme S subunit